MNEDIVLYCKSYPRDFLRLKKLLESIERFNQDKIPFYISTPEKDKALLNQILGPEKSYRWVSDESIITANKQVSVETVEDMPGGVSQAIIKSEFWRLGLCKNYVCLDSDCIFIKNFTITDFLGQNKEPYTIAYENKDYFQLAIDRGQVNTVINLQNEASRTKELFGREGPNFYCHCPPFIWSTKVWQSLEENFLNPQQLNLWSLATQGKYKKLIYPETLIYLETLFKYCAIPLQPKEQLFRVYYSDWHYYLLKRLGEKEHDLKTNYLGVIYQSNWQLEMDYGSSRKSLASIMLKKLKRFLRLIQSYF